MDVQEYNTTKAVADQENPTGVWAGAPALAATTVEMTNTSGYTVWADVNGGTVTVISHNGEVTGVTSGSIRLAPGDGLAITYSVAPNVSWSFDGTGSAAPFGAWGGAPSVAATTVPMFNTSGSAVTAHVVANGSTITVIKVDGVTTALTSGSFRLRRGGSLTLTYSGGTPAIAWVYA